MDDAAAMRAVDRRGRFQGHAQDLLDWQWSPCGSIGERLSLAVLEDEVIAAVVRSEIVEGADVRMMRDEISRASRSNSP